MTHLELPAVLMVDDEEDILPEYQEFLELKGFKVLATADPEAAYNMAISDEEIGLVITDLRMAKCDGETLIRKLRKAVPQDRALQFLVLTGDAGRLDDAESLGVPLLLKPAEPDILVSAIASALSNASRGT